MEEQNKTEVPKINEDESMVVPPERTIVLNNKWSRLLNDPAIKEAVRAGARSLANGNLAMIELIPLVGEIPGWFADAGKLADPLARKVGVSTDLTPDVPKWAAIGSELGTFGHPIPTHLVETIWQLRHDIPRIRTGIQEAIKIVREEQEDYRDNKAEIDAAMETFDVTPPAGEIENG